MTQSIQPIQAAGLYLRLLVGRQAELLTELNAGRREVDELREPVAESDQPALAQQSRVTQRLSALESTELSRINDALKKIRTGTYGICERCGSSIATARLKAIPWAEHCLECAEVPVRDEQLETIGKTR
jgi:DnaK suppressor protein